MPVTQPSLSRLAVPAAAMALCLPLLGTAPTGAAPSGPAGASAQALAVEPVVAPADDAALDLQPLGTYRTGVFDASAAEIVRFHAGTDRLFVVNAQSGTVDVLDASDPTSPTLVTSLEAADVEGLPGGTTANSVAIREDGLVAVAVEAPVKTDDGWIAFLDATTLEWLGFVEVGALPDMVTITDAGDRAVVANEGEPSDDFTVDPQGSVGVIDLPSTVTAPLQSAVRTADFNDFEDGGSKSLPEDVRVFGPVVNEERRVSTNLEPEYVALEADGSTAYAVLQEANAVAVVDLATAEVTEIWPLGFADHGVAGQGIDSSDRDDEISIEPRLLKGVYMPDGIESYSAGGTTYLVTANEGDAREWGDYVEPVRAKDLGDDGTAPVCEDAPVAALLGDADLGRLNVTTASGLNEAGTCYEELYSFGSRSFSIWTTDGEQVFDSGDEFEQVTAEAVPEFFNSTHTASNLEGRSDDKGPEPENLAIGTVGARTYAFIGFERIGGIAVYDITSPAASRFVTYVNNRDFSVSVEDAEDPATVLDDAGDLGPEGVEFISAEDSPTGQPLVAVGNEVSGTTSVFGVTQLVADRTRVAVSDLPRTSRFGRALRPVVRVTAPGTDAVPAGRVVVRDGRRVVAAARVVGGTARPVLPARLRPDAYRLTVAFVSDEPTSIAGSQSVRRVTVLRARTATTLRWKPRQQAAVVRVRNTDTSATPTGRVSVDLGRVTRTVRLSRGVARVRVGAAVQRVRATYPGTASFARSVSKPVRR
jgi:5'-nucleotidase